ncbi:MAG TPA: MOSC domain-containing protein [Chthonomonadaceae bacterium]|nr:MOSC domain-containing protein [Chthonomonadaceae bacterium]
MIEVNEPRLLSVQVGRPRTMEWEGQTWTSDIYKAPVSERLFLDRTNLNGDKQANTRHHGGPDKAVCCFSIEHYPFWREELGRGEDFTFGAFGENFTLAGMTEERVCIGDVYAVGTARVQVSQPRQPCINLARKWGHEEMPRRMQQLGHSGFYLRVLQTGEVGTGDAFALLERPNPQITVAVVNAAIYNKAGGPEMAKRLATLSELARSCRWIFVRRLGSRH